MAWLGPKSLAFSWVFRQENEMDWQPIHTMPPALVGPENEVLFKRGDAVTRGWVCFIPDVGETEFVDSETGEALWPQPDLWKSVAARAA
jgi:hypothetical protein